MKSLILGVFYRSPDFLLFKYGICFAMCCNLKKIISKQQEIKSRNF